MTHPSKDWKWFSHFSTRRINDAMEIDSLKRERDALRDNLEILMREYSAEKRKNKGLRPH